MTIECSATTPPTRGPCLSIPAVDAARFYRRRHREKYACAIVAKPEQEQLAGLPLFASLTPEQVEAMAMLMERRREQTGTVLVGEGAPGYALFVILDGTAVVTSGDETLGTLGLGDFFGEIALLGEGRRTATVTATSPIEVFVMHGSDFRVFERDWPEASELMKAAMRERLERTRLFAEG